ncbi:MAG: SDR family oxidoreductase [Bacteroidales bacterium]|nr:SDR family oxidoreductase [Bacteroidales bacterium]
MDNILVIGANGKIGRLLIKELNKLGKSVFGMIRSDSQANTIRELRAVPLVADLERDFSFVFNNIDCVVFTAGSGSHTGTDKIILVDEKGAIKSIDLAIQNNIKRFVMVSVQGARDPENASRIQHYYRAKHNADDHLIRSGLEYTKFRPGRFLIEPGNGKVMISDHYEDSGSTHRSNLALAIALSIDMPNTGNRIIEIFSGETDVYEALKNL